MFVLGKPFKHLGLVLMSAIVGAGLCACPNGGNHRGLPLQKMDDLMIKPKHFAISFGNFEIKVLPDRTACRSSLASIIYTFNSTIVRPTVIYDLFLTTTPPDRVIVPRVSFFISKEAAVAIILSVCSRLCISKVPVTLFFPKS